MQVCSNPSGVIGSGASGNEWHDVPCVDVNPYCVVMAGGATCVASPTTTDKCPDAGPATWVCTGDAGETPAFCNQGFLQNSPVSCNPPASYCTLIDAGAYCALDGGGPAPGDAGVD